MSAEDERRSGEERRLERRMDEHEGQLSGIRSALASIEAEQKAHGSMDAVQFASLTNGQTRLTKQLEDLDTRLDVVQAVQAGIAGALALLRWVGFTAIGAILLYFFLAITKLGKP